MTEKTASTKRVLFVHPDLGIGGAERLVIDAAVGLQSRGHRITVLTSYRDTNHCFDEARDGTLDVRVRGDRLFPQSFAGRFSILFAILRQIALVFSIALFSSELKTIAPDIIFVDQLSVCVPLFRYFYPRARVLFYGHYPDRLLVKPEKGIKGALKRGYRVPFDATEGWSTGCADSIVVNSNYTRSIYRKTFDWPRSRELKVIYPCVNTKDAHADGPTGPLWPGKKVLLSINRFEGKKNLALAIKAYAGLTAAERGGARLVMAGGYDPNNAENAATHRSLQALADSLGLTHATFKPQNTQVTDMSTDDVDVLFLLSIPQALKERLLQAAWILIYTPTDEHFGIVPLEAMLARTPVLATNTGGPLETIYDGRTGWLRSPDKIEPWTDVLRKPLIPSTREELTKMGHKGQDRVLAEFSETKMIDSLQEEMERMVLDKKERPKIMPEVVFALLFTTSIAIPSGILATYVMFWAMNLEEQKMLREAAENATSVLTEAATAAVISVREEL
ncbi:hypothetical protein B0A48_14081 [Cryoendolithus antarcticus]|uniref:Alpha-1,3/1,6-mannosyltransferase ALG2 n=1 Tax=Cryoendolithus antarcticus TaxID=1507870 RepID=A0A1V8SMJ1_9PEZI|nr:hypothetical protein B0A48_14081 [Cryoendolithus antarcticus]